MIKKITDFIKYEIIQKPIKDHPPRKMFLIRQAKIFLLAIRGFNEDRVQLRASALTYFTLLSIVPIVAMIYGIAKGFGFEYRLETQLKENLEGQEEVMEWIINFAEKYLSNIQGGVIAGIGLLVLLWSVMKLLGNIESSFNDIWQIKKSRIMSRKLSDYISLVVIAPILLFLSSSITIFLTNQFKESSESLPLIGYISSFVSVIVKFTPYILIWLIFTLLYIIMPNTKVKFKSAMIGGIIAGTMFQFLQWGYISGQSQLTSYGAVYGSFAALPLFLIWLQLSWLIVLFGAEVSFANQNVEHYEAESESINISNHLKRTVSILIARQIALNFKNGEAALTAEDLANMLNFPVRLVRDITYELLEVNIISETVTRNVKENAFQPARDINNLTVSDVINLLDKRGKDNLSVEDTKDLEKMIKLIDSFSDEIEKSKNNKLLIEL